MVTVIFPAAGQGKRMKAGMNKVFLQLAGKPILVRTLLKFSDCPSVDRLVIVVAADEVHMVSRALQIVPGLKPFVVTAGGSERQYSIYNGLSCMDPATDIVLVHDAARPMVTVETIEQVISAARLHGAAIAAVKEKNTIKLVAADGIVQSTPDRANMWSIQTPQGFQRELLIEAYMKASQDGFLGTDDASLVERLGRPVYVVESDYRNIKITTPEDLLIAEAFLRSGQFSRVKEELHSAVSDVWADVKKNFLGNR